MATNCISFLLLVSVSLALATNESVIASITPDLYILDVHGNQKRLEHVALTYNSHVTIVCRTSSVNEQLLWHYSVFESNTFLPVSASPYLSIDQTKRGEIALEFRRVQFSMAGIYQCSNNVASRQISVHVYGILNAVSSSVRLISKRELVGQLHFETYVMDTSNPPMVACQFQVGRHGVRYTSVRWKGGKLATHPQLYRIVDTLDNVNGYVWSNLSIRELTFDQALYGKYICQFNIVSGSMESAEVEIIVPPIIKRPEHGMGYFSDRKFSYTCHLLAYPTITGPVSWSRDEQPITLDNQGFARVAGYDWEDRVRLDTEENLNDRIIFNPLRPDDRAVYSCSVRSPLGNATGAFFLRVKDRWAVFWPLIGIVLEVVVLFIVILMYEIRRRALAKQRNTEEQSCVGAKPSGSALGYHDATGDTSIRYRQARA
ncbi:hypothetical protein T265_12449 [Opisthorchis viverrini]|uniref:Ig-like domain-containing protein n=1 Tax=Opisthorchis viverrini TaxID=6198 RepID=A0A075AJZ3_OPIVI|nr:hypothetical protein T265_12449 [Opisthorchis viverrini]KER34234.1 hypothetical protein T265_12449 [Opisthorchis viverrini]